MSGVHHADQQTRSLIAVVQSQRNLVALLQACGSKVMRECTRGALQLGIGENGACLRRDQIICVWLFRCAKIDVMPDRTQASVSARGHAWTNTRRKSARRLARWVEPSARCASRS